MAIATGEAEEAEREAEVVEPRSSKGPHSSDDGIPLIDGRLTVRCMRRVDWTVDCMGDQVAEAIVCFLEYLSQGRGWFY